MTLGVGSTWTVVDDEGLVVDPAEEYLSFARDSEFSPNTLRSYAKALALWFTFLGQQNRRWDAVRLADLGGFLQAVRRRSFEMPEMNSPTRQASDATVAARVRPVMSFYRYHSATTLQLANVFYERGRSRSNSYLPFLEHVARRTEKDLPRLRLRVRPSETPILSPSVVDDLLQAEAEFDPRAGDWAGDLRYRLLWSLLFETGMRISEALSLQHRDWKAGRGETARLDITPRPHPLGIELKSGARSVFIGGQLDKLYGDYVFWLCARGADAAILDWDSSYVFCNAFREPLFSPLRPESVYAHLARMKRTLPQLPATMTPHWFRHTHATALLLAGVPLHVVSRRLGHQSVQTTTNTYAHVTEDSELEALANWRELVSHWQVIK